MRGNTRLFCVPSSSAEEGFSCLARRDTQERGHDMDRLKRVVMQALASVGVQHDDLETFTDSVCGAVVASFNCLL